MRSAGLEGTAWNDFFWDVQEQLPAMTFVGYTDAGGHAYSHLEQNEYTGLIEQYRQVQYNNLFGGVDRREQYFSLK